MTLVSFGLGLGGGSGGTYYIAVDGVTMEVDVPDIELVYEEEEIILVVDNTGVYLVLEDEDIELEVD